MAQLLAEAYDDVLETLQRNRTALDKTVSTLLEQTTMSGQQVRMTGHLAGNAECATDCTASSGEQQVVKGGVRVHHAFLLAANGSRIVLLRCADVLSHSVTTAAGARAGGSAL